MKKNLIALAVAGALVVPMTAAANVTIYGSLQQELVHVDDGTNKSFVVAEAQSGASTVATAAGGGSGPSTLGFRATHDLGNGMKATADYSLNPDTQAQRNAYVNLDTGTAGTIWIGRMGGPYNTSGKDVLHATFMQARGNGGMRDPGGIGGTEVSNTVAYSNKFGPVSLVGGLIVDETASSDHGHAVRAEMNMGDIAVWVANASANGAATNTASKIGAAYTMGDLRLMGQYEVVESGAQEGSFMLGQVSYKMGANTLAGSYGRFSEDGAGADTTYMALGVVHSFSRAVRAHAGYRVTDVDGVNKFSAFGAGLRVGF